MASCRKEQFATPEAAQRHMKRLRAQGVIIGASATEYQCAACGLFHWGRRDLGDKALANAMNAHQRAVWPPRRRAS